LNVTAFVFKPRPKRLCRKKDPDGFLLCGAMPDNDNLEKAIYDCLKHAGIYTDDKLITINKTHKLYHSKTGKPGMILVIDEYLDPVVEFAFNEAAHGQEVCEFAEYF
jgi:Holliday junction resolvase RusA-like endonuclease